jgi:hypothetical protein
MNRKGVVTLATNLRWVLEMNKQASTKLAFQVSLDTGVNPTPTLRGVSNPTPSLGGVPVARVLPPDSAKSATADVWDDGSSTEKLSSD